MKQYSALRSLDKIHIPFVDLAFLVLAFGVSVSFVIQKPVTANDVDTLRAKAFRPQEFQITD